MKKISRKQQQIDEHAKFLARYGIKQKKRLKGYVDSPLVVKKTVEPQKYTTSDTIPATGVAKVRHKVTTDKIIGQPYNKGPLMVLSSKADLQNAKRRDR